jgi:hypothetical protein
MRVRSLRMSPLPARPWPARQTCRVSQPGPPRRDCAACSAFPRAHPSTGHAVPQATSPRPVAAAAKPDCCVTPRGVRRTAAADGAPCTIATPESSPPTRHTRHKPAANCGMPGRLLPAPPPAAPSPSSAPHVSRVSCASRRALCRIPQPQRLVFLPFLRALRALRVLFVPFLRVLRAPSCPPWFPVTPPRPPCPLCSVPPRPPAGLLALP